MVAARFNASSDVVSASSGISGNVVTSLAFVYMVSDRNTWTGFWSFNASGTLQLCPGTNIDGTSLSLFHDGGAGELVTGRTLATATWYKIAVVCSGTTGIVYHAPLGQGLVVSSGSIVAITTPPTLTVGSSSVTAEWNDCRLAGLRVWLAALSYLEIEAEFNRIEPLRTANLLRSYTLDNTLADGLGGPTLAGGTVTYETGPTNIPLSLNGPVNSSAMNAMLNV